MSSRVDVAAGATPRIPSCAVSCLSPSVHSMSFLFPNLARVSHIIHSHPSLHLKEPVDRSSPLLLAAVLGRGLLAVDRRLGAVVLVQDGLARLGGWADGTSCVGVRAVRGAFNKC